MARDVKHPSGRPWGPCVSTALLSIQQQLREAHVQQILGIVSEAEHTLEDKAELHEVYESAMKHIGRDPLQTAPEVYGEICVRRLQVLSSTDPREARVFWRFLAHLGIQQKDSRVHLVKARLEVQAGRPKQAMAALAEGLRCGAEPAAPLRELLESLMDKGQSRERGQVQPVKPVQQVEHVQQAQQKANLRPPTPAAAIAGTRRSGVLMPYTPLRPRELRFSCEGMAAEDGHQYAFFSSGGGGSSGSGAPAPTEDRGRTCWTLASIPQADNDSEALEPSSSNEALAGVGERVSNAMDGQDGLSPILEADTTAEDRSPSCVDAAEEQQQQQQKQQLQCSGEAEAPEGNYDSGSQRKTSGGSCDSSDLSVVQNEAGDEGETCDGHGCPQQKTFLVNGVSYVRLQTIGRGGSSKVYEVKAPNGKRLAIKRVIATCTYTFEACKNEVTLLRSLSEHPHVIRIFDADIDEDKSTIQIVMELGEKDLSRLLEQNNVKMCMGDLQQLWREMLEAVEAVHAARIVHSDLKPANFLLVDGRLKLIDFGIAKRISCETTNISRDATVGTISYMAPEAVKQGTIKLGRAADIWSLGIILYQMAYHRSPFAHLDPMQRLLALVDPSVDVEFPDGHVLEGYSTTSQDLLIDVLKSCLQREPSNRASIPQLLEHPFLCNKIRLERGPWDRTMESVISCLCEVVRAEICGDGSEDNEDSVVWQKLADHVWEHLSRQHVDESNGRDGNSGTLLASQCLHMIRPDSAAIDPFRECLQQWLARGGGKRQKTESFASATEDGDATLQHAAPPAAATASGYAQPSNHAESEHHRVPLSEVNRPSNRSTAGKPAASLSFAEELAQKQRGGLRRAAVKGKENSGPKAPESLVLRRLRERRDLCE